MEIDKLNQQQDRLSKDISTYADLIEVKDETIVKLTNQVHENELKSVMNTSVPPSPGGPRCPPAAFHPQTLGVGQHPKMAVGRTSSNGISFDSDRGEFKEFVDVGVQTNEKASTYGPEKRASEHITTSIIESNDSITENDIEKLQDMVTAYEMQNKFLNKEVLELNQLRQQAIDREQKLFM